MCYPICTINSNIIIMYVYFLIWPVVAVVLATAGLLAPGLRTGTLDVGILERGASLG